MLGRIIFTLLVVLALVQPLVGHIRQPRQAYQTGQGNGSTDQQDEENRIIISEPYKTMIRASAQLAVAQAAPSITEYIGMDATMKVISDAGYELSKYSVLSKLMKPILIVLATLVAGAIFAPRTAVQLIQTLRDPEQLSRTSEWFMNGLVKSEVVKLLRLNTMDFLKKVGLNEPACSELTACRVGQLIRCKFPSSSDVAISFIESKNLRRNEKKYPKAFFSGFIDQNCGDENSESLPENCAGNLVKHWTDCSNSNTSTGRSCKS